MPFKGQHQVLLFLRGGIVWQHSRKTLVFALALGGLKNLLSITAACKAFVVVFLVVKLS